jgi:hypothetical protein
MAEEAAAEPELSQDTTTVEVVPVFWPEGEEPGTEADSSDPAEMELPDEAIPVEEPTVVTLPKITPPRTKPAVNRISTLDDEIKKLKGKLEARYKEQIDLLDKAHEIAVLALQRSFQQELATLNRLLNEPNIPIEIPASLRTTATATTPAPAVAQPRVAAIQPAPVPEAPARPSTRKINPDIEQIAGSRGEPFTWLDMKKFLEAKGVTPPEKGMIQLDLDTMVRNRVLKKDTVQVTKGSVVYYVSVSVPHKIVEMVRTLRADVTSKPEPSKPRKRI